VGVEGRVERNEVPVDAHLGRRGAVERKRRKQRKKQRKKKRRRWRRRRRKRRRKRRRIRRRNAPRAAQPTHTNLRVRQRNNELTQVPLSSVGEFPGGTAAEKTWGSRVGSGQCCGGPRR
jgi:hypothetical protein